MITRHATRPGLLPIGADVKILFIRLRLIGDLIFTTPAIRAVKQTLPNAHVSYLIEVESAAILARNPYIDDLIVVERPRGIRRLQYDFKLARRVRAARFDAVVDFHGGPRSSWLTWRSAAAIRIGYALPHRYWAYTHRIPVADRPPSRHSVVNQWDLLAALDDRLNRKPDPTRDSVEMAEDPAAAMAVSRRLAAAAVGPTDPLVVIHVSAGNPFRRWALDCFIETIKTLALSDAQRRFVITAGPSDRRAVDKILFTVRAQLGQRAPTMIPGDGFNLPELRSLIGRAALFVGGDSGPLHLAATTSVPIVGIYGPTLSARSTPWRSPVYPTEAVDVGELSCRPCDQRHCEPGDFRCLTTLPPSTVIAAAERALKSRNLKPND
ncbi:MAG: hypothetical protein CL489_00530 [Acidobacteria bacterium]|nr:hypothetical protein [Acidobacteriota bacterium]MBF82937.1 hypothetical protein [Acidobacteriota bacterium]